MVNRPPGAMKSFGRTNSPSMKVANKPIDSMPVDDFVETNDFSEIIDASQKEVASTAKISWAKVRQTTPVNIKETTSSLSMNEWVENIGSESVSFEEQKKPSKKLKKHPTKKLQKQDRNQVKQEEKQVEEQKSASAKFASNMIVFGIILLVIAVSLFAIWWAYVQGFLYNLGPVGHWLDVAIDWIKETVGIY